MALYSSSATSLDITDQLDPIQPKLDPKVSELLKSAAALLNARYEEVGNGFDSPPEPRTQWDLEAVMTANDIDLFLGGHESASLVDLQEVSISALIHSLERSAGNTDTDWRWRAACSLRECPQWETAIFSVMRKAP